jgi:hypothetical protein
MIKYNIKNILEILKSNGEKVVLFGAGQMGEMCFHAMKQNNIKVDYFCDSSELQHGKIYDGIEVITPKHLETFSKKTNIFISSNYVSVIKKQLEQEKFENIYDCVQLLENANFSDVKLRSNLQPLKVQRRIEFYKNMGMKDDYITTGTLNLKSLDIQITERCSLKCKDCSNLMQYYTRPENTDLNVMLKSIDRFLSCVSNVNEFRVIGGDPFMNKEMHKYVDYIKKYDQVKKIVIYTNARIIPKDENLECLKNKKVILDISDYGLLDSKKKKVDELIKLCEDNNIAYTRDVITVWQDCGRILPYQKRSEQEQKRVFDNCCNSDLLSLLHGKLYRCPFSANGTNLKAIPNDKEEIVDLYNDEIPLNELKVKIKELTFDKKYLTACNYCNGRDYKTPAIDAAMQAEKILTFSDIK